MNGRHSPKVYERPYFKILMVPFIALLVFLAVMMGIQAGDLLYKLDVNLVENIDSETFRDTMKFSLPIIENVYNNGKSSTSFTGEIKSLFTKVFGFDLDSPMTILNVQSPLFMSYYNNYKSPLALNGNILQDGLQKSQEAESDNEAKGIVPETGSNPETGNAGTGSMDKSGGNVNGTGGGNSSGNDTGSGKAGTNTESGTGLGIGTGTDTVTDTDTDTGTDKGSTGTGTDKEGNSGGSSNTGSPSLTGEGGGPLDLQPISSITYEAEDEDEKDGTDTVSVDKIAVKNFTKHKIDIAALLKEPLKLKFDKKGPKVLIYHTHTSESYVLRSQDLGKKNVASYNTNPKYNVVRVGEELSRYLQKYGIETLHNATVHDKNRNAAYGVAIDTLQSYKKSYPSIKVFIDIHRDGLDASQPKLRITKKINGKNAAQVMFVVGTDDMLPHAQWEENLKFALRVQQKLNEKYPGLARPVWIVGKRYNQQVSNQAVLIEIGGDGNLLSECIESTRYVAEALNDVMKGK